MEKYINILIFTFQVVLLQAQLDGRDFACGTFCDRILNKNQAEFGPRVVGICQRLCSGDQFTDELPNNDLSFSEELNNEEVKDQDQGKILSRKKRTIHDWTPNIYPPSMWFPSPSGPGSWKPFILPPSKWSPPPTGGSWRPIAVRPPRPTRPPPRPTIKFPPAPPEHKSPPSYPPPIPPPTPSPQRYPRPTRLDSTSGIQGSRSRPSSPSRPSGRVLWTIPGQPFPEIPRHPPGQESIATKVWGNPYWADTNVQAEHQKLVKQRQDALDCSRKYGNSYCVPRDPNWRPPPGATIYNQNTGQFEPPGQYIPPGGYPAPMFQPTPPACTTLLCPKDPYWNNGSRRRGILIFFGGGELDKSHFGKIKGHA